MTGYEMLQPQMTPPFVPPPHDSRSSYFSPTTPLSPNHNYIVTPYSPVPEPMTAPYSSTYSVDPNMGGAYHRG